MLSQEAAAESSENRLAETARSQVEVTRSLDGRLAENTRSLEH